MEKLNECCKKNLEEFKDKFLENFKRELDKHFENKNK